MPVDTGDPTSRSLRAQISNAVRWGYPELAEELRVELRLVNIERAIAKQLDGLPPLNAGQLFRLRKALESYGTERAVRGSRKSAA